MTPAIRLNLFTFFISIVSAAVVARSSVSSMEFAGYVLCVLITLGWFGFMMIIGPGGRR